MHAYTVSARMVCSASGGPLSVILWGGITDWGSHKGTDGRFGRTDARPRRSELRGSRPLGYWWHSGWLQSYSLARNSVRQQGSYLSLPPLFPQHSFPVLWRGRWTWSRGASSPYCPCLSFHYNNWPIALGWRGLRDPVNWCTKPPIKK